MGRWGLALLDRLVVPVPWKFIENYLAELQSLIRCLDLYRIGSNLSDPHLAWMLLVFSARRGLGEDISFDMKPTQRLLTY